MLECTHMLPSIQYTSLCLTLKTHLFFTHLQLVCIRLLCILLHTCYIFMPFLWLCIHMSPGFVECLGFNFSWLGVATMAIVAKSIIFLEQLASQFRWCLHDMKLANYSWHKPFLDWVWSWGSLQFHQQFLQKNFFGFLITFGITNYIIIIIIIIICMNHLNILLILWCLMNHRNHHRFFILTPFAIWLV